VKTAEKEAKKKAKKDKINDLKKAGKYVSKEDMFRMEEAKRRREAMIAAGIIKAEDENEPEEGGK
jgi:hypothetical protein